MQKWVAKKEDFSVKKTKATDKDENRSALDAVRSHRSIAAG
jgi:hypothetical protein